MASRLKDKGRRELGSFKRRILRQRSMDRIGKTDADWLTERVEEIERYLDKMTEYPELERKYF